MKEEIKTISVSDSWEDNMLILKTEDVRNNFKKLCDKVVYGRVLLISRPRNENVVMLSEKKYNELIKIKKNADYLAVIDKSMAEAETGGFVTKSILTQKK